MKNSSNTKEKQSRNLPFHPALTSSIILCLIKLFNRLQKNVKNDTCFYLKFPEVYIDNELQLDICYNIFVASSSSNLSALHKKVMQIALAKLFL